MSVPPADVFAAALAAHRRTFEAVSALEPRLSALAEATVGALRAGNKVLIFGNGGSASDAQHLAAELTGRYQRERRGLAAIALTTDTSALTAIANDYGYEAVFSRQVEALACPGDVVLGISTSGNSPNVLAGLKAAEAAGCSCWGFAGKTGGEMAALLGERLLVAPSDITARIQEAHIFLGHTWCELVEEAFV